LRADCKGEVQGQQGIQNKKPAWQAGLGALAVKHFQISLDNQQKYLFLGLAANRRPVVPCSMPPKHK
jgi:hypothetical protein